MTRVAAFDCGTNSLRLLVADIDVDAGTSTDLVREMRIVRLGQGVDRTGRIADASLQRVFGAVEEYMEMVREHDVSEIRFCATSAARDAENSEEFVAGIRERVGVEPEVLDGDEEARVSFAGATRDLPPLPEPLLVIDIGGGSTELILGNADGTIVAARVAGHRLGAAQRAPPRRRPADRRRRSPPPSPTSTQPWTRCSVDPADAGAVIGVAGTVTTLAAAVLDLATYDRTLIHHSVLRPDAVQGAVTRLLAMMVEQRKALPYMHPGRADVIGAGGLILDRILRRTTVSSMLVSEHDILDGIAWSLATPSTCRREGLRCRTRTTSPRSRSGRRAVRAPPDRARVPRRRWHRPGRGAHLLLGAGDLPGPDRAAVPGRRVRAGAGVGRQDPRDPRARWSPATTTQIGSTELLDDLAAPRAPGLRLVVGVARCALVGLGLRRRLQPGDEPDLRGRGGPAVLADAADAAHRHGHHRRCCARSRW